MLNDFRVQTIVWDKAIDRIYETVRASEGDSNGRKLRVQILDRGKYVDLGGTSLSLAWKTSKEDAKGLDAFELVDSETGTFEIYYTTEMLGNVGRLSATLVLVDSVGRIESSPFAISVIESNVDDDLVQSENSFTALTQALITVSQYDSRISNLQSTKADRSYVDSENRKVNRKVDDEVEKLDEIDREIKAQLAHKVGGDKLATLNDFDEETLNFIHDGTGGPVTVESVPKDNSVTVEKTTFLTDKNLFDGKYVVGQITGSYIGQTPAFNDSRDTSRVAIVKLKPLTTYTVFKDVTENFMIALNHSYPNHFERLSLYVKGADTTATPYGENQEFFTFTTNDEDVYVIIQTSHMLSEEPFMTISEGSQPLKQPLIEFNEKVSFRNGIEGVDFKVEEEEVPVEDTVARSAFIDEMNKKATDIGMVNTNYVNPHGLEDINQISSARDTVLLGINAFGYGDLAKIWHKKNYSFYTGSRNITLETTVTDERLENYYHLIGGKTGTNGGDFFTRNLLSVVVGPDDELFVGAVFKANHGNRFEASKAMFDIASSVLDGSYTGSENITAEMGAVALMPKHNTLGYEGYNHPLLWGKDEDVIGHQASITKVMTALVTLDYIEDIHSSFEIIPEDIVSSYPLVKVGEKLTFKDALFCLMLPSSNDVANALSRVVGEKIVRAKNKY